MCWPPPTPSSTRGPIPCPRRSWTVSCCGCPSGIPPLPRSGAWSRGAWTAAARSRPPPRCSTARVGWPCRGRSRTSTGRTRWAITPSSWSPRTAAQGWGVVSRRLARRGEEQTASEVLDGEGLLAGQGAVEDVHVEDSVGHYAVELVAATRVHQHSLVGASPRGTLALITCARALALIRGRTYVVPEDVKALAHPALDHRVTVKPELWLQNATGAGVVESVLGQVEVPAAVSPPVAVGGRG